VPVGDAVGDGDDFGATEGVELFEQPPEAIAPIATQIDTAKTISFSRRESRCILIVLSSVGLDFRPNAGPWRPDKRIT